MSLILDAGRSKSARARSRHSRSAPRKTKQLISASTDSAVAVMKFSAIQTIVVRDLRPETVTLRTFAEADPIANC